MSLVRRLGAEEVGVHSVLFYGAQGGGKEILAEVLAQLWLCQAPGAQKNGACQGDCRVCNAFARGTAADFLRIEPAGASRIIRRGAILTGKTPDDDYPTPIREFLRTGPLMAPRKVVLIDDAHRMNGDAANALLKTLEEPHPYAKLILVSDSIGSVLPTILSRCLAVACSLPSEDEIREQYPQATSDDLQLIGGSPLRLKRLLDKPEPYRQIIALAKDLLSLPPGAALIATERLRKIAEGIEKASGLGARAANAESVALLATYLSREPAANPRWAQLLTEAHRRIIGNVSATPVLDATFSKMLSMRPI